MQTALSSSRPLPTFVAVFSEQLWLVGRSLWREAAVLGAGFALLTVFVVYGVVRHGLKADFPVDASLLLAGLALVMPAAVWRGEKLFGQAHLWTLPVERRRHLLIKALAGGVWLLGVIAWIMLWLAAVGLISGSDMGIDRNLLLAEPGPNGQVAAGMIRQIHWVPETWNWAAAFTTGTVFYLLGTAAQVGVRYKLRWAAGLFVVLLMFAMWPTPAGETARLADAIVETLLTSPVGLDYALSGGVGHLDTRILLPDGKEAVAWSGLPSLQLWMQATAFWLALGLGLVWLAASRHREG